MIDLDIVELPLIALLSVGFAIIPIEICHLKAGIELLKNDVFEPEKLAAIGRLAFCGRIDRPFAEAFDAVCPVLAPPALAH